MQQPKHTLLSIFFIIIIAISLYFSHYTENEKKKIVIVTQNSSHFCSGIINGIISDNRYTYTILSAENDQILLKNHAEKAMAGEFDCAISIAALASKTTHNTQQKRKSKTPLIFVGVRDPVEAGLVKSEEKPETLCTGITLNSLPLITGAEVLLSVYPKATSVLIPYCPSSNGGATEKEAFAIQDYLKKKNIITQLVAVHTPHEAVRKTQFLVRNHDSVLVLTDGVVTDAIEGIIKTAEQYSIPVVSFNTASINAGAIATWGGDYESIGKQAMKLVKNIIEDNNDIRLTPVCRISNWKTIIINKTHPLLNE